MTLSFPAWRKGEVRICGGLIDEALRRGHDVRLRWKIDRKPGEGVDPRALRARWPEASVTEEYGSGVEIVPLAALTNTPADVSLDYCLNHLHAPPPTHVGMMTFFSTWERQQWERLALIHWKRPSPYPKLVVTGDPSLDGLTLCDPEATRYRYGFGDKPVVLVFALKFALPGNYWRRTVYRWLGYRRTLQAIRDYCDRMGALLVVKTREKHDDPAYVASIAHHVLGDEDLYPSTSHQLLRCASLAIHWQSGAVYEGVAAGVPQMSIRLRHPHLNNYAASALLFGHVPPHSPQDWRGVVDAIPAYAAPEVFRALRVLPSLDATEHAAYAGKILGVTDGRASARVLDAVEGL